MPIQINIPKIGQLDPKQADYPTRLDEGLSQMDAYFQTLNQDSQDFIQEKEAFFKYMQENGVPRETFLEYRLTDELVTKKEGRFITRIGEIKVIECTTSPSTKEESRRIEDLTHAYYETKNQKAQENNRQSEQIKRAHEDYIDAILGLTEIKPLNDINANYRTVHLFIPRQDGVYEMHINLGNKEVIPVFKKEGLTPDLFADDSYIDDFRKHSEGVEANAYLVKNPSKEIPVEILSDHASLTILKQLRDKLKDLASKRSVGQKLVSR